ncbi:MAG: hypothetical protein ACI8RD_009552 [Bacillariaceae sp.]|jgi:hypothetical protein
MMANAQCTATFHSFIHSPLNLTIGTKAKERSNTFADNY